jgi:pimeloyl-ACP methyl ester carboxylesterase
MSPGSPKTSPLAAVERAFATLPERYLGARPGFEARYRVSLEDLGRQWEIHLTEDAADVVDGVTKRKASVELDTDARTWIALRKGSLSGAEAFSQRRIRARGDLDLAVAFEGFFRLPNGRAPLLELLEVDAGRGRRISTLTMGRGHDVVLIHGLGGTKSSFFETAAALAAGGYRVHAIDLPGFGASSKPLRAPYNAKWFAETVVVVLDALNIDHAFIVGNSMGGRVALEVGLTVPERVDGLALLSPAVAFVKRDFHPIVRVLRPEWGLLPHAIPRPLVARQFWSLFHDREAIDEALADVVVDGFRKIYANPGGRHAFLASARNIYLDTPWGRNGFYARLADLAPPALFVWGSHDWLIPASFRHVVDEWLPTARHVVLPGCGHVPQVEQPDAVNPLLLRFFDEAGRPRRRGRGRRRSAA